MSLIQKTKDFEMIKLKAVWIIFKNEISKVKYIVPFILTNNIRVFVQEHLQ